MGKMKAPQIQTEIRSYTYKEWETETYSSHHRLIKCKILWNLCSNVLCVLLHTSHHIHPGAINRREHFLALVISKNRRVANRDQNFLRPIHYKLPLLKLWSFPDPASQVNWEFNNQEQVTQSSYKSQLKGLTKKSAPSDFGLCGIQVKICVPIIKQLLKTWFQRMKLWKTGIKKQTHMGKEQEKGKTLRSSCFV